MTDMPSTVTTSEAATTASTDDITTTIMQDATTMTDMPSTVTTSEAATTASLDIITTTTMQDTTTMTDMPSTATISETVASVSIDDITTTTIQDTTTIADMSSTVTTTEVDTKSKTVSFVSTFSIIGTTKFPSSTSDDMQRTASITELFGPSVSTFHTSTHPEISPVHMQSDQNTFQSFTQTTSVPLPTALNSSGAGTTLTLTSSSATTSVTLKPDGSEGVVPTTVSTAANPTTTTEQVVTTTEAQPTSMYGYGSGYQDFTLSCAGQASQKHCWTDQIAIRTGVRLEGVDFTDFRVNTNGYIEFGYDYLGRQPTSWDNIFDPSALSVASTEGFGIIAGLWVDNDQSFTDSAVYYHLYDRNDKYNANLAALTQSVMDRADSDAMTYGSFSTFSTTQVIVVTWANQLPRVWYDSQVDKVNTYQLVIIIDSVNYKSMALINFEKLGWDSTNYIRPSQGGLYVLKDSVTTSFSVPASNTAAAFQMKTGNTGIYGVFAVVTSSGVSDINYGQLCYNFYYEGLASLESLKANWVNLASCPCDMTTARIDNQWTFDRAQKRADASRYCYYLTTPAGQVSQECCYERKSRSLITTIDGSGGSAFLYSRKYDQQHQSNDITPKENCCVLSNNCDLYYVLRPIDDCTGYVPPRLSWGFGDPHVSTMDLLEYTFNGLGEYTLLETTDGEFILQGRTEQAVDTETGNPTFATVYTGFAAAGSTTDRLSVLASADRTGFQLYLDSVEETSWFTGAAINDQRTGDGVTLTKSSETSMSAFFSPGFSLSITLSLGVMQITVGAPAEYLNNTRGLLGVFNGDPLDDLTTPSGNIIDIASHEKTIYYEFGEQWKIVSQDQALFYYEPGTGIYTYQSANFEPFFVDEVLANMTESDITVVTSLCSNDTNCIFDYVLTKDVSVGNETLVFSAKNTDTVEELSNNRPILSGERYFNVTMNETNSYYITVEDPDGDSYTLSLVFDAPEGTSFNNVTGEFTWVPTTNDIVNISFSAVDSRGGVSALLVPIINFCDCSGAGNCLFDTSIDGSIRYASFHQVQCICDTGYAGQTCNEDEDGCRNTPCLVGTECYDLTPEEQVASGKAFNCSACPTGYFEDISDYNCIDIDECNSTTIGYVACDMICKNTVGSFECVCESGYRLNSTSTCIDIDECDEGTDGCQQECDNTLGSYECSCVFGFELNPDNHTCNQVGDLCDDLQCSYGCTNMTGDTFTCICPSGYQIVNSNQCEDTNECLDATANKCQEPSLCSNTDGSYDCDCLPGYTLASDSRTCNECPQGYWGVNCAEFCNCKDSTTVCNGTTGCEECRTGFTGGSCSVDVNECDSTPCRGPTAVCNNTVGSFLCLCSSGYQSIDGLNCVEIDECASNPCQNNGQCNDYLDHYNCTCVAGYTGDQCETDVDECASDPCQNGGTCSNRVNKYRCTCTGNWTGSMCERSVTFDDGLTTAASVPLCVLIDVVQNTTRRVVYEGQIVITDITFLNDYKVPNSPGYLNLLNLVQPEVDKVYKCSTTFRPTFVETTSFAFRNTSQGYIIVDFEAHFVDSINATLAEEELSAGDFPFTVDPNTVSVARQDSGLSNWVLIVIIVCVLLAIVCAVLLVLLINTSCCRHSTTRSTDWSEDSSTENRPFNFPKPGLLVWQDSDSMRKIAGGYEAQRINEAERLRPIHHAVNRAPIIDWSVIRQFASRQNRGEAPRKNHHRGDLLHRGPIPNIHEAGPSGVENNNYPQFTLTPTPSPRMPRSQYPYGQGAAYGNNAPFGMAFSSQHSPRLAMPLPSRVTRDALQRGAYLESPDVSPTLGPRTWNWRAQSDMDD